MARIWTFIGFYWTLPVTWAGFTDLPKEVDAAAQASRTIRYQRDLVRRWVVNAPGTLIAEEVFLELAPDRGSEQILPTIQRLLARCRAAIARAVAALAADNPTHAALAEALNEDGVRTPTGRRWTAESLRKFLKSL